MSERKRDRWKPKFETADHVLTEGLHADPDTICEQMMEGGTPWPVTYLFRPEEISEFFRMPGLKRIRLAGPGALARTIPTVDLACSA